MTSEPVLASDSLAPMGGTGLIRMVNEAVMVMAQKVSRNLPAIIKELDTELAAIGPEGAENWYFSIPFKQRDADTGEEITVYVEGPSVRAAEAVQRAYGFLFTAGLIVDDRPFEVIVAGVTLDLVKGNIVIRQKRVPKEKWSKNQKRAIHIPAHQLEKDIPAAVSKGIRDAIFASVPEKIKRHVFTEAKRLAATTLDLDKTLAAFSKLGVTLQDLETLLGHPLAAATKEEHLRLKGIYSALRSGEATVQEVFAETRAGAGREPAQRDPAWKPLDERIVPILAGRIYAFHAAHGRTRESVESMIVELERHQPFNAVVALLMKEAGIQESQESPAASPGAGSAQSEPSPPQAPGPAGAAPPEPTQAAVSPTAAPPGPPVSQGSLSY